MDNFAAARVEAPIGLHWGVASADLREGGNIVTLEFDEGYLSLNAPMPARLEAWNRMLDEHAEFLTDDPYGAGWIAELTIVKSGSPAHLLRAETARHHAWLDLRRLRRRIALHLLADADEAGPGPTACHRLALPCRVLDGSRYLELLRELVH